MKNSLLLILMLQGLFVYTTFAQAATEEVIHSKRSYKTIDSLELIAHVFYVPSTLKKKNNSALAFFHGGGWAYGEPAEFFQACRRYASMGFVAVSFHVQLSAKE